MIYYGQKIVFSSLHYFLLHLLPQVAEHTLNTGTSEGQASMQASNDPGHDPLEAFPPAPPRAYNIAGVVLIVLSSPMFPGCLVVVLVLVVLGCLVVFLALFPPLGAPSPE